MTMATKIPSVLQIPCSTPGFSNSLSVERVLKQAIQLLETGNSPTQEHGQQVQVTIDDLQAMIDRLDR